MARSKLTDGCSSYITLPMHLRSVFQHLRFSCSELPPVPLGLACVPTLLIHSAVLSCVRPCRGSVLLRNIERVRQSRFHLHLVRDVP